MKRFGLNDIGKRYGSLVILKDMGVYNKNRQVWCECDCGTEKSIDLNSLRRGLTTSCGCYSIKLASERLKGLRGSKKPWGEAAFTYVFAQYKNSAEKRNLEFNLTQDEVRYITSSDCEYCGEPPSKVSKNHYNNGNYVYNGIDRVDNNRGYTLDNIVPCCRECNVAKGVMSLAEFKDKITRIYLKLIGDCI